MTDSDPVHVTLQVQHDGEKVVSLEIPGSAGEDEEVPCAPVELSARQARSLAQALVDASFLVEETKRSKPS